MLKPAININNLSKVYYQRMIQPAPEAVLNKESLSSDDKVVLENINLKFQSGEIIGLIGRNGAGKSTLLSILAGISPLSHGTVDIQGKVTAVLTLGIGLREDLTGRENIYLDGALQGKSKEQINEIIHEIIDFSELAESIDKPLKTYSTGMKSRLAFSMLVTIDPEILIIDEALSAGDFFFAEKASRKIKEICSRGKIVLIVSHSMETINAMCNRCLWLEKGQVIMDGMPSRVTEAYVQKIKKEDELDNFDASEAEINNMADSPYKINVVKLSLWNNSHHEQKVFYTKDSFAITIEIQRLKNASACLVIEIERLDGLLVSHETLDISTINKNTLNIPFYFHCYLECLVLNTGYYKITSYIIADTTITNIYTKYFEVKNNHIASGGVPLLHYPTEIKLQNEDVNICSDLSEPIIE